MQIYKITNLINGKIYIGKEKGNNENYLGSGILVKKSIKKYGKENFKKEIIQICETNDVLNKLEKFWIKELNSFYPIGYNISKGGDGGWDYCNWNGKKHTEESKQKMSKSKKGKYVGENNPNFGKTMSDENKQKMSLRQKDISYEEKYGKEKSDELKEKQRNNMLGRILGPSPKMMGENNPSKREDVKKIISIKKLESDKNKIECEYCHREFDKQNYAAWHGDKCKQNIK